MASGGLCINILWLSANNGLVAQSRRKSWINGSFRFDLIDSKGRSIQERIFFSSGFIPPLIPDRSLTNPLSSPTFLWWFYTCGVENFVASLYIPHPVSVWALRQQRDEFAVCRPVRMRKGGMCTCCWGAKLERRLLQVGYCESPVHWQTTRSTWPQITPP